MLPKTQNPPPWNVDCDYNFRTYPREPTPKARAGVAITEFEGAFNKWNLEWTRIKRNNGLLTEDDVRTVIRAHLEMQSFWTGETKNWMMWNSRHSITKSAGSGAGALLPAKKNFMNLATEIFRFVNQNFPEHLGAVGDFDPEIYFPVPSTHPPRLFDLPPKQRGGDSMDCSNGYHEPYGYLGSGFVPRFPEVMQSNASAGAPQMGLPIDGAHPTQPPSGYKSVDNQAQHSQTYGGNGTLFIPAPPTRAPQPMGLGAHQTGGLSYPAYPGLRFSAYQEQQAEYSYDEEDQLVYDVLSQYLKENAES